MFNSFIVASVAIFKQGDLDKNGKEPVILVPIAGTCPNRNVLSGTVAENMGIETGKTYLFSVREAESDPEYGRRFVFTNVNELSGAETLDVCLKLGPAVMLDASENAAQTATKEIDANVAIGTILK